MWKLAYRGKLFGTIQNTHFTHLKKKMPNIKIVASKYWNCLRSISLHYVNKGSQNLTRHKTSEDLKLKVDNQ